MKRTVLLSLLLIGFAALATATPMQCSVFLTPNETAASIPCSILPSPQIAGVVPDVPEFATLGLLGGALVGVSFLARRKSKM